MKNIILFLLLIFPVGLLLPQSDLEKTLAEYNNPEELVTLSENISFDQAIAVLSKISEKSSGKKIVSTVSSVNPIGVLLDRIQYKRALSIIVQYAGYTYDEGQDLIVVKSKDVSEEKLASPTYAGASEREVKISAVFFEADVNEMKTRGINWQFLLSGKEHTFQGEFNTFSVSSKNNDQSGSGSSSSSEKQKDLDLKVGNLSSINIGDYTADIATVFKFFETNNLGEIIASPNITVRNGQKGRIQVGSDFSIKQRDFSGNVIDRFFSTGSIIEVTPHVYSEDTLDYVLLELLVERSSAIPSEISTEIKKTNASTQVLMLNGEETVIGGLYINEETTERTGIPFLKDLPWWVFGIKYIAGSNTQVVKRKEVVILIHLDLLPTLRERLSAEKQDKIQKEIDNDSEKIKFYKSNMLKSGN